MFAGELGSIVSEGKKLIEEKQGNTAKLYKLVFAATDSLTPNQKSSILKFDEDVEPLMRGELYLTCGLALDWLATQFARHRDIAIKTDDTDRTKNVTIRFQDSSYPERTSALYIKSEEIGTAEKPVSKYSLIVSRPEKYRTHGKDGNLEEIEEFSDEKIAVTENQLMQIAAVIAIAFTNQ